MHIYTTILSYSPQLLPLTPLRSIPLTLTSTQLHVLSLFLSFIAHGVHFGLPKHWWAWGHPT